MTGQPDTRAELPDDAERFWVAGFMRARLGAVDSVFPLVDGLKPIDGPHRLAPDQWRATWRLLDGRTIEVEARGVGGDWQVVPVDVLDDRD